MGGGSSKNLASVTAEAITKVTNNYFSENYTKFSAQNTQIVDGVDGNVNIDGDQIININVDSKTVMKILQTHFDKRLFQHYLLLLFQ